MISHKDLIKDIINLEKHGIKRHLPSYSFIVVYPPPKTLKKIQEKEVIEKPPLALYFHIPFCTGKCTYCKFYSFPSCRKDTVLAYLATLKKELALYIKKSDLASRKIHSIYFGGGTPTFLKSEHIIDLLDYIKSKLNIEKNAEITFESCPETITKEKLTALLNNGVNRLSIGIQDFNDNVLNFVRRRHNGKQAINSVKLAKKLGFKNLNIDLIYGLPRQTIGKWKNNLKIIEKLKPAYITTYHLRREKDTPIEKLSEEFFPSKEENMEMYLIALKELTKLGYIQIAPDQFALKNFKFKHQEHKWKSCGEFLGLGASAYSFINNAVYYNMKFISNYTEMINAGKLPFWIGKKLSPEEQWARYIIFGLKTSGINRKDGGVDKILFEKRFGLMVEEVFEQNLKKLTKLGLLESDDKYLRLTLKGLVMSEEIGTEFYSDEIRIHLEKIGDKFGRGGL